jgi:hypothetical protein
MGTSKFDKKLVVPLPNSLMKRIRNSELMLMEETDVDPFPLREEQEDMENEEDMKNVMSGDNTAENLG